MHTAQVWVAYASPTQQFYIAVDFEAGMTIQDALDASQIMQLTALPEPLQVGVWGVKATDQKQLLNAGDRVEIYRALTINPKDIRRKRAASNPVGRYVKGHRFKPWQS